jgi:hypothetical protein
MRIKAKPVLSAAMTLWMGVCGRGVRGAASSGLFN